MGKSTRTDTRGARERAAARAKAPSLPERRLAERRALNRAAWARRHPLAAAGERALRKARAELVERWTHKNDGTPETHEHARHQEGALTRLYRTGAIDSEQLASAVEIALVAERIARDVTVKTASLETRVDTTRIGDGGFFEALGQVRREVAYSWWRARLRQPAPVLDMLGCFDGDSILSNHEPHGPVGFTVVARRYRMHHRRAKQMLIDALDLWPEALSLAFKEVDERDLAIAHARLAA